MSVRCFTACETSGLPAERRGTYLGVAEKVSFKLVGVSAEEVRMCWGWGEGGGNVKSGCEVVRW